jgi:hypothetical protein
VTDGVHILFHFNIVKCFGGILYFVYSEVHAWVRCFTKTIYKYIPLRISALLSYLEAYPESFIFYNKVMQDRVIKLSDVHFYPILIKPNFTENYGPNMSSVC